MEIGKLRHRIQFQTSKIDIDSAGIAKKIWKDVGGPVWAAIDNLWGREFFAAAAVHMEQTVKFRIRYCPDVNARMRVVFRGEPYHIIAVDNAAYKNEWLVIRAKRECCEDGNAD